MWAVVFIDADGKPHIALLTEGMQRAHDAKCLMEDSNDFIDDPIHVVRVPEQDTPHSRATDALRDL